MKIRHGLVVGMIKIINLAVMPVAYSSLTTPNTRSHEAMHEYQRKAAGANGSDVLCAWALAAAVLLSLLVLSLA